MDIRERNYIGFVRESESPMVPHVTQGQHNLEREGAMPSSRFLRREVKGDCVNAENPEKVQYLHRKLYQKAKQEKEYNKLRKPVEEDDWKAVFGKTERTV